MATPIMKLSKRDLERIRDNVRPKRVPCMCGTCDELTDSRFAPGHDARFRRTMNGIMEEKPGTEEAKIARQALLAAGYKPETIKRAQAQGKNSRKRGSRSRTAAVAA